MKSNSGQFMIIENQCMVTIHYRLSDEQGQVIDASLGKKPLQYVHGGNGLIPGLEQELTGKSAGDHFEIAVQPKDGYGFFDPDLIKVLPIGTFEGLEPIEPGMCFETRRPNGQVKLMTIQEVSGVDVTVNENHPLAGQVLHFDVKVEDVRVATPEELAQVPASVV